MCNRYENELPASALAELIPYPMRILDDALHWEPHAYQGPNSTGLCIVQQDGEWTLRTANWGFVHPTFGRATFNTRTDAIEPRLLLPTYLKDVPEKPDPKKAWPAMIWREHNGHLEKCWMPATAWLENKETKTEAKKHGRDALWFRMHLAGDPFLLAGICGERGGKFRMSMLMTEAPASLPAIAQAHNRMPLVFGLDAIGQADPRPIHERVESVKM